MTHADNLQLMRSFFNSNACLPVSFRLAQLKKLRSAIKKYELQIYEALKSDLGKSIEESWVTENGFILSEINHAIKHLEEWVAPESVPTNLLNFPGKSYVVPEPLGVVFIIGPWNYPFQLILGPLIGAMAAGNCVVLKPSELAPAIEKLIQTLISTTFPPEYIRVVMGDGGVVVPEMMQAFRFDHIFFTGSTTVGKKVYQLAAMQLVPVTLELGGKSPAVVDADANITVTAKRIAMAKFSNAGQMCVAPDYILVHRDVAPALLSALKHTIIQFFGENPAQSYDYGKIINQKQFQRLTGYLDGAQVYFGGNHQVRDLYIAPTLLFPVDADSPIMQEEIFGPLLPVLTFSTNEEALAIIKKNENPLAAYFFTSSRKKQQFWLQQVHSGGACINTASLHLTNPSLPFGGRGNSGIGRYHGRFGFETFSHLKAVMQSPIWPDLSIRYPSYARKLSWFKKFIGS